MANFLTVTGLKTGSEYPCASAEGRKFGTMGADLIFPPIPMPGGRHQNDLAALEGAEIPSQLAPRSSKGLTNRINHLPQESGIAPGNWTLFTAADIKGAPRWQL
jgi:hypothetical protein